MSALIEGMLKNTLLLPSSSSSDPLAFPHRLTSGTGRLFFSKTIIKLINIQQIDIHSAQVKSFFRLPSTEGTVRSEFLTDMCNGAIIGFFH